MTSKSQHIVKVIGGFWVSIFLLTGVAFAQKSKPLSEADKIKFDATYINANKEKLLNNYDESIKLFRACLTLEPDNAAVNYMLSEVYDEKQLFEDAELYAKRAVKFDEKNIWYKKQLAEVYKERKKYKEAAPIYMEIAKQEKEVSFEIEAAYMYVLAQEYSKAVKTLDMVEKQVGINEEVVRQKEQIYLAQNKLDKAIKEVEKLIKAYPNEPKYIGMLADLYMANEKTDKGVQLYNDVLKIDPQNGFAHFALADYYRSKGDKENYFLSTKAGMASKTMDVKSKLTAMVSFISAKELDNHTNKCYDLAHTFIDANPNEATSYMVLGDLYNQDKDYESARKEFLKAVAIEPSTYMAWQQIVFCSSELRNNNYLQNDAKEALEYFPNEPAFYIYYAIASMQLKDYETAFDAAKKGIEVASGQKEMLIQLYSTLGDASQYLKRFSTCDSAYEEALKLDATNAYALNNYAYFLSLRKVQLDRAEQMSKKSLEIDPENSSYMDTYGWILYQRKEYDNAKVYIEKALKASPNSAESLEHLGDIEYKLNQKDEAIKNWKRAKELGSSGEFLDKKIKESKLYE
jgi:tetratricopeptide (TPR) repeat protein